MGVWCLRVISLALARGFLSGRFGVEETVGGLLVSGRVLRPHGAGQGYLMMTRSLSPKCPLQMANLLWGRPHSGYQTMSVYETGSHGHTVG